jgi:hypothetical protein
MENKLYRLFCFLENNRIYNKNLQIKYYRTIIKPSDNIFDKLVSLLYHIANTQSQPKIDKLAKFYRIIYQNRESLNSFSNFIKTLDSSTSNNYKGLFESMKSQEGWGNKTAALFTKSIFHLHNGQYPSELRIWDDAPCEIVPEDVFYLPVDIVITSIFEKLDSKKPWNFETINEILKITYIGQQIELWDDLWFWGFITQNGSGENRKHEWNENKYWALEESDKNAETITDIKSKANTFLDILKS